MYSEKDASFFDLILNIIVFLTTSSSSDKIGLENPDLTEVRQS
jgi:hypothetical protein